MQKWPCKKAQVNLKPEVWAQESYRISKDFSYSLPLNDNYQAKAQDISLERIALAGCRLAKLLDESVNK